MMLATFLLVLKIIGITILAILSFVLLIILLVLFVPVRYMASGSKERDEGSPVRAEASASWLLKIVSAVFEYNEKGRSLTIRIFGIRLRSREEKEERRRLKDKKKAERKRYKKGKEKKESKTKVEYTMVEYDDTGDVFSLRSIDPRGSQKEYDPGPAQIREEELAVAVKPYDGDGGSGRPVGEGLYEKLTGLLDKIWDKVTGLFNRIRRIIKNIGSKAEEADYYINALTNDASNRQAIALIIKKSRSLLRSVSPKKLKGRVDFGADDPADTGRVLAAAAVAYPLYSPGLKLNPDFENKVLAFDAVLKGRIYVFVLLKTFAALYFNKRVKRFIKIMKKENNGNGR